MLKPIYEYMDTLRLSLDLSIWPENLKVGVSKAFSFLAKNPVPGGPRFIPADSLTVPDVPSLAPLQITAEALFLTIEAVIYSSDARRISRFEDRWYWIERERDGMWPLWTQTPEGQSITLVSTPLQKRAEEYVIFIKLKVW